MTDNPLDKYFGIGENGELIEEAPVVEPEPEKTIKEADGYEEVEFEVDIPDDATLDDIARLSLEAYKMQIENLQFIEPKFRNRYLEVAQTYLSTARDAIKQKEDVRQKEDKLKFDKDKHDGKGKPEEKPKVTRSQLYEIAGKKNEA